MAVLLMSTAMVFSSCKKDEDPPPAPPPVDPCENYLPNFSPTYLVIAGQVEYLDFYITCTTDDWEMIKVIVASPGGLITETFTGNGMIMTQNAPFGFSNIFIKLGGTWTFAITGNIKSGDCVNKSFTVTTSILVSGK